MQLHLGFLDLPVPESYVWQQLTDQQKAAVLEMLKRLMIQTVTTNFTKENNHD